MYVCPCKSPLVAETPANMARLPTKKQSRLPTVAEFVNSVSATATQGQLPVVMVQSTHKSTFRVGGSTRQRIYL